MLKDTEAAARTIGVELQVFEAKTADQFEDAFGAMARAHVGG